MHISTSAPSLSKLDGFDKLQDGPKAIDLGIDTRTHTQITQSLRRKCSHVHKTGKSRFSGRNLLCWPVLIWMCGRSTLSKSWQALRKLRLPAAWAPHTQSRCSKTRGLGLCKVADVHVEKTWRNNTQEIVLQCDWSLHDLHLHLHVQRDWPHGKTDLRNYRLITNLFGWHTFDEMLVNHGKSVSALQSFTFQDWHF